MGKGTYNIHMDIATTRPKRPKGLFGENRYCTSVANRSDVCQYFPGRLDPLQDKDGSGSLGLK